MLITRRQLVAGSVALAGASKMALASAPLPTSPQDLGPFYPVLHPKDHDADLTRVAGRTGVARGDPIQVIGRVLDLRGNPVRDARVELWQANAIGRYDHPGDGRNAAALDPDFQGYAEISTDRDGEFRFRSIKPGSYQIPTGQTRTPHIHFDIRGHSERLITQLYFPGEALNDGDLVLRTASRRESVMAVAAPRLSGDPAASVYRWDVVLAVG